MRSAAAEAAPYEEALAYLSARTGIRFPAARRCDAAVALGRVEKKFAIGTQDELVHRLRSEEALFDAVIAEITVGETYFFREPAQIDAIRQLVLPALTSSKPASAPLRVWSAGCSTGEEAYTLAMILEEEGLLNCASILGTDISAGALNRARRAHYGLWSMRADPEGKLNRYFVRDGKGLKVIDRLRKRVRFERLNLASDLYPSPVTGTDQLDLILCRNVLIYFSASEVKRVAKRLYASLANGGWLIAGASDPPLWHHAPFTTVIAPGAVIYRREAESVAVSGGGFTLPHLPKPSPAAKPLRHRGLPSLPPARAGIAASHRRVPANEVAAPDDPGSVLPNDEQAWLERVRLLTRSVDLAKAEAGALEALARHPFSIELHYLRSVLLIALNRNDEAIAALRRLLYLDRSFAAAHLALGTLFQRGRDLNAARRSFESAYRLCAARPTSEVVPLTEGETAGALAESAKARIAQLNSLGQGG